MRLKIFFIIWMFLCCSSSFLTDVSAATYCVSSTGNDSNDGLAGSGSDCTSIGTDAWQTITKVAASSFSPGDIVKLADDQTWEVTTIFTFPSSGSLGTKISVPGWNTAGNWTQLPDDLSNIWYITLSEYPYSLYLDGSESASTQAEDVWDVGASTPWTWDTNCHGCSMRLYVYATANPASFYSNIQMHDIDNHITFTRYGNGTNKPIVECINTITGWDDTGNWTDNGGSVANTWYMTLTTNPRRVHVNGAEVLSADRISGGSGPQSTFPLSSTYKFFWQSNRLYIYSATNPASTFSSIEGLQNCSTLLDITDKNYVKIDGIDFRGGHTQTIAGRGSAGNIIQNNSVGYGRTPIIYLVGSSPTFTTVADLIIRNNTIDTQWGFPTAPGNGYDDISGVGEGIEMRHGLDDVYIYGNSILNVIHTGVKVVAQDESAAGVTDLKVFNNILDSSETFDGRGFEIVSYPSKTARLKYYYNAVSGYHTASKWDGQGAHIHHNYFVDNTNGPYHTGSSDVCLDAAFVCLGTTDISNGNILEYNVFSGNQGMGFIFDQQSSPSCTKENHIVRNNSFYGLGTTSINASFVGVAWEVEVGSNVGENTVRNNHVYNPSVASYVRYNETNYTAADFNNLNGEGGNTFIGNISGDPLFVDPGANNFNFSSLSSPLVEAGFSGEARFDWVGSLIPLTSPDIGLFQVSSDEYTSLSGGSLTGGSIE